MSDGFKTTFQLLAQTPNEAADRVLIGALDSPHQGIRDAALVAILTRHSQAGHREILRRLDKMDPRWKRLVAARSGRLGAALREAVLGDDLRLCANACRAAVWFREYDLVPALITALEDPLRPTSDLACKGLRELVELLSAELALPQPERAPEGRQGVRRHVVGHLEASVRRYAKHRRQEIIEALVLLADCDSVLLKEVIDNPHHPAFLALVETLSHSAHAGVISLLLGYLESPQAPSAALTVIAKRTDLKFLQALLQRIGHEPSATVAQNLARIESMAWLKQPEALLDQLEEPAQHAAVELLMKSGVPRAQVFGAIRHVLLYGAPSGRRSAALALDAFAGAEANELAAQALGDEDPQVQANVLGQLRRRGIPGALVRLVEMVDSPQAAVRKAARQSLAEFSFRRFLAAFDMLDDEVRRSTGRLVKKIDLETVPLLRAEMESKICRRRLRALEMAHAVGAVAELEPAIIALLDDEDHLVRVQAALTLARCNSPAAREALAKALEDCSPLVQEASRRSLAQTSADEQPSDALVGSEQ